MNIEIYIASFLLQVKSNQTAENSLLLEGNPTSMTDGKTAAATAPMTDGEPLPITSVTDGKPLPIASVTVGEPAAIESMTVAI